MRPLPRLALNLAHKGDSANFLEKIGQLLHKLGALLGHFSKGQQFFADQIIQCAGKAEVFLPFLIESSIASSARKFLEAVRAMARLALRSDNSTISTSW